MIIVMAPSATKTQVRAVIKRIVTKDLKVVPLHGSERTVIAVVGNERLLHKDRMQAMAGVEKVIEVVKPYKLVSKEAKEKTSKVRVGNVIFGGEKVVMMAGPCSVESEEQIMEVAERAKAAGATVLRGGAFKPRTGPYSFQGLGLKGLKILAKARKKTGMKIVTEVVDVRDVPLVDEYTDIFQIGARNMQNYPLLREVGKTKTPVLLKRGLNSTYNELLLAAEYIMSEGNREVILCERGIRTFEDFTRNTLDICAVPALKSLTHLPVVIDPSHGTGRRDFVLSMSRAAIAAGADGIIVEVHPKPSKSVSDADQTISCDQFDTLMDEAKKIAKVLGRDV